jgi:hypothetical protein
MLGAISLDMVAGLSRRGHCARCPIYARDILHNRPWALGLLRSATAVVRWRCLMALANPLRGALEGDVPLRCDVRRLHHRFRLSHHFVLSSVALLAMGAVDMVSVVIRLSLVQLATRTACADASVRSTDVLSAPPINSANSNRE